MQLRFGIDQAACFSKGTDCSKTEATINVDPATLTQEQRDLIAARLDGINVVPLVRWAGAGHLQDNRYLISAAGPTLQDLLEAIENNEAEIKNPNGSPALDAHRQHV